MAKIKIVLGMLAVFLLAGSSSVWAQDPGWPRQIVKPEGKLVYYQPQIDDWQGYQTIFWRAAFTLTPAGGHQVVGAATTQGTTAVDTAAHLVEVFDIKVTNTYFPSLDPDTAAAMGELLRNFLPPTLTVSLDRIVASMRKPEQAPTVELKNDPPFIFVSYSPAILLDVDGEPVLAEIPKTNLKYVVNTHWPLFLETSKSQYYLQVGQSWLTAGDLHGPWAVCTKLPRDMDKLPKEAQWFNLDKVIPPPPQFGGPIPKVFYSTSPAEVILFDGRPVYTKIPRTQLLYVSNTDSPVFFYSLTNEFFYLAAGRWFRSASLEGPWTFASLNLPQDFANIPLSSPASAILSSVPGTQEAKDAVLIAQIPTVMLLNPQTAAAQAKVEYSGEPQFAPIQGTSLYYATNTVDKVIQVGAVYYLCLQGVWFMSTTPQGPWTTAGSVPQVIYTIPPSSPVYNVTFVTQTTVSGGYVQSSYTAGYMGAFVMGAAVGAIVASGTGYYYPPYIGYPAYGYPVYHPYPAAYGSTAYYNSHTGAYGVSQTAYGPNGTASRSASYNPYTGTSTRTASVSTPYGSQKVGQAYNPYTGSYGATHQGSSPNAQWGQSMVSNGNRSATAQHYSTAQGTTASVQGSQGGKAVGGSSAYGSGYAGKTSNGDMYAGHDGNVYKNTGSGWQKYDNGSWNSTSAKQQSQSYQQHPQSNTAAAQQRSQSMQGGYRGGGESSSQLNQEAQNRQRGDSQSQRFSGFQRSGGGFGGFGGFGGGGRSFGGFGGGDRSFGGGGFRR